MRSFDHVAQTIRERRINHPKNYSQSELSCLLGYKNGQFISNVERGLCSIPVKMMKRVTEVLDMPYEELKNSVLKDHERTLDNFYMAETKGGKFPAEPMNIDLYL